MEKETLFIAFSTQKGGAGKTTLTVLVASYLHYVKGMNVAVVDCDYPQHSIAEMRKRDLKTVMEDEHYKLMAYRQLQRIRKKAYPIAESTAEDAVTKADELLEKMPETDIVFFDLPVDTAAQRKEYRLFRKYLVKEGFLMLQESVYAKLVVNDAQANAAVVRLRQHRPPAGLVQALKVTEKQFAAMEFITGARQSYSEIDTLEGFVVL